MAASRARPRLNHLVFAALLATAVAPRAPAAPTITRFPSSQTVAAGQSVTFTVEATGTAPLSYQWYRGASAIPGATADTLTLPNVQPADAGLYAVAVTDATGTTRTFAGYGPVFAAGVSHTLFTKADGALWGAGLNGTGQLGDGTTTSRATAVPVAANVAAVATGGNHTLFVKTDGTLWVSGANTNGQLGDGSTVNRLTPVQVATGVAAVAAGLSHSLFRKTDGTLWAMGANTNGQLGDGTGTARLTPVQVATGVQAIAAWSNQSFFVKTDGSLWSTGFNGNGQLGDGTTTSRLAPVQVATGVAAVAAGVSHTLFLKTDGSAWAMGLNNNGQLGDGSNTSRLLPVPIMTGVSAVSANSSYSLFLKTDGTLWGTGFNGNGQFGDGSTSARNTPGQVGTGISAMSAGESYSFTLRTDGTLWASGANGIGQLADGSTGSRTTPLPVVLSTDVPAILGVMLPPTITIQPVGGPVNAGAGIVLLVGVTGTPPLSNQWFKDGVAIPGATGATLTLTSFSIAKAGNYTVTVTNPVGTATSLPANLTLAVSWAGAQVAVTGKPVSFLATTGGAGTVSWQLSTDGGATWTTLADNDTYSGTTGPMLRIAAVTPAMTNHLLRFQVSNGSFTATSNSLTLTAITSPLVMPTAIMADPAGGFYVADTAAQTVLHIAPDLKLAVVAGRTGETGSANGPVASARFNEPGGFLLAGDGSLVLADTANSSIRVVQPGGAVANYAGQSGAPGAADGSSATAQFNAPTGVVVDIAGNYVVADQGNHTIRLIAGGLVQTIAGRAGLPGVADGQGTAATFNFPGGLAVRRDPFTSISWSGGNNGYGTIFVSDQVNHTIRTITTTGLVGTYVGLPGAAGFANGGRTFARLRSPTGLTLDFDGNLYIADTGNHVIRRVDLSGTVSTFAGTPNTSGLMDGASAQALFNAPEGLAFDTARNLYVADTGNGLIRKITPAGQVSTLAILGNVPAIASPPASQTAAPGASASFSVTASGEGPLVYQWKKDGVMIPGATSSAYTITTVAAANAGSYTVSVSNLWGATESSAATLTIGSTPPPGGGSGGSGGGSGGGGGGGGAPSLPCLALLAAAAALRGLQRRPRGGQPGG